MRVLLIAILASLFLLSKPQNVEIRCEFIEFTVYTCQAHEFVVTRNNRQTIVIVGDHLPNKTNADVLGVQTINQPLPTVITEFFIIFPNLMDYTIVDGLHTIQEGAFQLARNLEIFGVMRCSLRTIPAYAMEGALKLTTFLVSECNELVTIDSNAFFGLTNIVQMSIWSSLRIIPENVFSTLSELRIVSIGSRIETIPGKLFNNNLKLEDITFMYNRVNAVDRSLVDNFVNMPNLYRFFFSSNDCSDDIHSLPFDIDEVHSALQQCYTNFKQRRTLSFELRGSLIIRDENGNLLLDFES